MRLRLAVALLESYLFEIMKSEYSGKGFELYCGDCLEVLERLPEQSVDLVFADPPYNLSNDGFTCHSGRMVSVNKGDWDKSKGFEEDVDFHEAWILACKRLMKPDASIWISGTYHSIYICGFLLQKHRFKLLNDIAWFKPNASPNLSGRYFTASHETLLWARLGESARHTFNYREMKEGDFPEDQLKRPGRQMRSVWSIPTTPKSEKALGRHPTQKPLRLLHRVIQAATVAGDVVLDPFVGSGSAGVAALSLDRNFVGIDTDPAYLAYANARMSAISTQGDSKNVEIKG